MTGKLARPAILLLALAASLGTIPLSASPRLLALALIGGLLLAAGEVTARLDEQRRFPLRRGEAKLAGRLRSLADLSAGVVIGAAAAGLAYGIVLLGAAGSGNGTVYLVLGLAGILLAIGALSWLGGAGQLSSSGPRAPSRRGRRP